MSGLVVNVPGCTHAACLEFGCVIKLDRVGGSSLRGITFDHSCSRCGCTSQGDEDALTLVQH